MALAALVAEPPSLLLLEDPPITCRRPRPTSSRDLEDFPGTVVVATHDRWVRRHRTHRVLPVPPAAAGPLPARNGS